MFGSRIAAFVLHVSVTLTVLGATSWWVSRGREVAITDLPQDYVSARAWLDGDSPYQPLTELHARYDLPLPHAGVMVRTNPHPPVAVLLTVPYARLNFDAALSAVRWTQVVALAVAWALCLQMFRPPMPGVVWALAGGLFGLWAPFWQGMAWGQPVGLLALGTVALWWLARSDRAFAFGLVLAAVTLIRPFFAMHVVLACGWSFRRQSLAAAGLLVGGLVPFALLGITPWEWYRLASDAGHYVAGCGSIPSVLHLGPKGGQLLYAVSAAVLAWVRWRGLEADLSVALVAVVAMLAYPLAWFQYDVALVPVVAWVAARVVATENRVALWLLVLYLMMRTVPDIIPTPDGRGVAELLARNKDWFQVAARGCLLAAVAASARVRGVSASEPS